jgi:hypothetical protein
MAMQIPGGRGLMRLFVLLALWAGPARADGLPAGRFTGREAGVETCLRVLDGHKLELSFEGANDREPIRVEGDYRVTANKMGDFHVEVKVTRVVQKQLTRCRKSWEDMDLAETRQLGRAIRAGDLLRLTLHYGCDGYQEVQLCSHDPAVVCRTLWDRARKCTPPPPIDGSRINAPAQRR